MSSDQQTDKSRRQFLGTAAAVAGVSIAPGVILHGVANAKPLDAPASSKNRWGILIDTSKCATGCNDCVNACFEENGISGHGNPRTDSQWIRKVKLTDNTTGYVQSLPLMCQHCEHPPCVDVCPTGASMKREDGIVLVDKHICIGCRYCMMACPYKARSFVHEKLTDQKPYAPRGKGTVESCTMCVQRVDAKGGPQDPACVEACNAAGHKAMWFGDIKDPDSEISKELKAHGGEEIRADLNLNTGVRYQNLT
jgi:molybdopterin-containing oxidoreductase family iron-sulfur binding subunit